MKYGETTFDIIYLLFAIIMGVRILSVRKDAVGRRMGIAVLTLGCGDAFHLIPRVLNYFIDEDFTAWLGFGKFVTSITITVFYMLMYRLWLKVFGEQEDQKISSAVYLLTAARILLCLLPQNRWLQNEGSALWGILRNIPFVILGGIIICLYWSRRNVSRSLRNIWLLMTLSFLCYIPVAVAASLVPALGMLMLPKTICYIFLIRDFWKYVTRGD